MTSLSIDQLRAIYYLATPCNHGCNGPTYDVTSGPTKGKYCRGCVDDLVGMFADSFASGRKHGPTPKRKASHENARAEKGPQLEDERILEEAAGRPHDSPQDAGPEAERCPERQP